MRIRSDTLAFTFPDRVDCGAYSLDDRLRNGDRAFHCVPLGCLCADAKEGVIIFDRVACAMERGDKAPLYAQIAVPFPDVVVLCLSGVVTFVEVQYMVCHSLVA